MRLTHAAQPGLAGNGWSLAISAALAAVVLGLHPVAAAGVLLEDGYGDAFVNYRPFVGPAPAPKASEPVPAAPPKPVSQAASAAVPPGPQKVDVAWLRRNYPLLRDRAIDDPSPDNVAAMAYVQRVVVDKSQRFSEAWAQVMREDPLLNENSRVPYASVGAQSVANADRLAQQRAARELAATGGLLVFVDGACSFCAMQLPIVATLKRDFGLEHLVVSVDGAGPNAAKGAPSRALPELPDNGLFKKLGLVLTPSIVYVPRPQGYASGADPNRYLVVAQGFYAQDELVKQLAYAGFGSGLLSAQTRADLGVWDRGVASTQDLSTLRLDVDDPQGIKRALQPTLIKRY